LEIDFEKSIERELKGLGFFFTRWVLASVRPDRDRTPMNKDAEGASGCRNQTENSNSGLHEPACFSAANLGLYVYTVNDPGDARRLAALGVTGITTDRPAYLRDALSSAPQH